MFHTGLTEAEYVFFAIALLVMTLVAHGITVKGRTAVSVLLTLSVYVFGVLLPFMPLLIAWIVSLGDPWGPGVSSGLIKALAILSSAVSVVWVAVMTPRVLEWARKQEMARDAAAGNLGVAS